MHTKSEQNFYKNTEQPEYYGREMEQLQSNFVNHFAMEDQQYRHQMMDKSFPNVETNRRGMNNWVDRSFDKQVTPMQGNDFLAGLDEEPEYVRYYKKMIPTPKKQTPFPATRTNPFK